MSFINGFCLGVGFCTIIFVVLLFGMYLGLDSVSRDCEKLGAFSFGRKVYKCTEIKDAEE